LVAVFVGVHFTSGPAPVASPQPGGAPPPQSTPGTAKPIGAAPVPAVSPRPVPYNPASLRDTMKTIQKELSSIGSVSYTAHIQDKTAGSTFQNSVVRQVSNVVADPAQCRVSYHFRVWRGSAVTVNKDAWFLLPAVTSVGVEPMGQLLTEENAAQGHPNDVVTSTTPPLEALVVRRASIHNEFPFTDIDTANRIATEVKQAVKLCGGHLAN
jgi:hypothetical protein